MLQAVYTKQFEKDLKRMIRRGKAVEHIKIIIQLLVNEKLLEARYKNHKLAGYYKGRGECHIQPDWLLINKKTEQEIVFERTGTHSDLFE